MVAVWYRCRVGLRGQWRSIIAIALLIGLATATVLTALAGERRTSSLFDRYVAATRIHDVWMDVDFGVDPGLFDRIAALPEVDTLARLAFIAMFPTDDYIPMLAAVDGNYGVTVDRSPIVQGRQADPRMADEVVLSEDVARRLHASVGSRISFQSYSVDQADAFLSSNDIPFEGPDVTLTVVGVARTPSDLSSRPGDITVSVLTPAFYEKYRDRVLTGVVNAAVRLRGGLSAVAAFSAGVRGITGNEPVRIEPTDSVSEGLHDSFRVSSSGLFVFAAVAAVAALVALATLLAGRTRAASREDAVLASLGMSRGHRTLAVAAPMAPAALVGAAVGALGALAASTFMPFGIARRAEPSRGFDADWTVLVLGALAAALLVVTLALVVAWREASRATNRKAVRRARPLSVIGRSLRLSGPIASLGAGMALEPGGGRRALVRPSLIGSIVGVGAVVGALGLGTCLDRLVTTPSRYGWAWDVAVAEIDPAVERLAHDPDVAALAVARFNVPLVVDGRPTSATGMRNRLGAISPTVIAGRAAGSANEIVLGTDTLARVHRTIGDSVTVEGPTGSRSLQVVGRGVFASPDDPLPLADGAALTLEGLDALGLADGSHEDQSFERLLVRWAPGVDADAARATLARDYEISTPRPPAEIEKLTEVDGLPRLLAAFLASIAVIAMGYALVTGVTRRRRDFAVLRTLGLTSRQLSTIVGWQSSSVTVFIVVVGVLLGSLIERTTWTLVANGLGVGSDAALPWAALVVAAFVMLFAANLIAFVPGRLAGRTSPALVLASE